jgi:hypothetical protein
MMPLRPHLVAALAATAALAVGAPAAGASTAPARRFPIPTAFARFLGPPIGASWIPPSTTLTGACGTSTGAGSQGRTGGTATQVCVGAGLSLIGPSIGQIATVNGPTTISPGFVGITIASAGAVAVGF